MIPALALALAYVCGSFPSAYLAGRLAGMDAAGVSGIDALAFRGRVAALHRVEDDDALAALAQEANDVRADVTGAAADQYVHGRRSGSAAAVGLVSLSSGGRRLGLATPDAGARRGRPRRGRPRSRPARPGRPWGHRSRGRRGGDDGCRTYRRDARSRGEQREEERFVHDFRLA